MNMTVEGLVYQVQVLNVEIYILFGMFIGILIAFIVIEGGGIRYERLKARRDHMTRRRYDFTANR